MSAVRPLLGIHHVRIPVSDLQRSFEFWQGLFGYERDFDFPGPDGVVNWGIAHPEGGPSIVLWVDSERADRPAPYPLVSLQLPTPADVRALADELEERGLDHGEYRIVSGHPRVFAYDPDRNKIGCYVRLDWDPDDEGRA